MNCSERDRLRPPGRIGAITEKGVNERVAKLTGTGQVFAKFCDRLCPIIRPQTGPLWIAVSAVPPICLSPKAANLGANVRPM